jgi:hypothetical protein
MADTYIFQGNNIGPNGIYRDGQNVPEILYALQKKSVGVANIVIDRSYLSINYGGNHFNATPNAFMRTHQDNLYAQYVPLKNPIITVGTDRNNFVIIDSNTIQEVQWSNYGYFCFGTSMSNDNISKKYISCNYPYIAYYKDLLLTAIGLNVSLNYTRLDTTYTHPLLQNAISTYYDSSYFTQLASCNVLLSRNNGSWGFDTDAGVITFYDSNTQFVQQVSRTNPPRISFFRYEGLFGEANILQGQDL